MSIDHYNVIRAITDFYGANSTDDELAKFLEVPRNLEMLEDAMSGINRQLDEFRHRAKIQHPFDPQKDADDAEKEKSSLRPEKMALESADTVSDEDTETVEKKDGGSPVHENDDSLQKRSQESSLKLGMGGQLDDPENPGNVEATSLNCNSIDMTKTQPQPATVMDQKPVPRSNTATPEIVGVPMREHSKPDVSFRLPNARVGVEYDHEVAQHGKDRVEITAINHLENMGLRWDEVRQRVVGTPTKDGTQNVSVIYTRAGETNKWKSELHLIVINDPKALWKDIPSNPSEPFWKPDGAYSGTESGSYLLVGASRRGRSHAHVGSCRDDDFSLEPETRTGWRILAVSDGAGSSKFSREGSKIAVRVSSGLLSGELDRHDKGLMAAMNAWYESKTDDHLRKQLTQVVYSVFRTPIYTVVQEIHKLAGQSNASFKDFYATLLIGAHKEVDGRHYVVGYWRGDGGIALFEEDKYLNLMGSPDGGEYAGQTRFMDAGAAPQEDILARVRFDVVDDMSAMLLLTDGITDPLFDSDIDLNSLSAWNRYWKKDVKPLLGDDPVSCSKALWESLDFWSRGNHDDRTIAVLYKKGMAECQQTAEIETADVEQVAELITEDTQADVEDKTSDEDNINLVNEGLTDPDARDDEPYDAELADSVTPVELADPGAPGPVDRRTRESTVGPVNRED